MSQVQRIMAMGKEGVPRSHVKENGCNVLTVKYIMVIVTWGPSVNRQTNAYLPATSFLGGEKVPKTVHQPEN